MKKSLVALAFGTLALGISEFVMMGILPDVAASLGVSITEAGHCISAYALGVCAGAPLLVFFRRHGLKHILMVLAGIIVVGNACAALSGGYGMLVVARFISGLPHGAYFGVGSIVADKLADRGKSSQAVAVMVAGMTVANLLGVPLGTALSGAVSWRLPFVIVACCGVAVLCFIRSWVPRVDKLPDTGLKGQFAFLRHPAPWMLILAVMLGNGGVFCWYSYISPLLVDVSGVPQAALPAMMVLAGAGMVAGNIAGGRMADRYTPASASAVSQGVIGIVLISIFFLAGFRMVSIALMCLATVGLFALSSPQQVLMIRCSEGGELLGAASVQVAFNLGNALGAYLGGLPIAAGLGYRYPALIGAALACAGCMALVVFRMRYERRLLPVVGSVK